MTGPRIVENRAVGNGGGIYLDSVVLSGSGSTVRDSVIAGNRALGTGGGIYNASGYPVVLDHTLFRVNQPNFCTGC